MDNENKTLIAQALVIALIVFGLFWIVGSLQNLYEQTEQKGQELSRCCLLYTSPSPRD